MKILNFPLNNAQTELLKLFSTDLSDKELDELKLLLSRFYAKKAILEADKIWDERGLTNKDMDQLINESS